MTKEKNIAPPVIRRLPRYYRFLGDLLENGVKRISSGELSARMGLTASQIRQDLNCFGGFGQQGYGYSVESLHKEIGAILGLGNSYDTVLIGAGNLGKAVAVLMSFEMRGFRLTGIFDNDPEKVGTSIGDIRVMDISELEAFCMGSSVTAAILCVPKSAAPELAERLYSLGIRSFLNFSHYDLAMRYDDIVVENVHLSDSLMILCYKTTEKRRPAGAPDA